MVFSDEIYFKVVLKFQKCELFLTDPIYTRIIKNLKFKKEVGIDYIKSKETSQTSYK